MANTTIKLSNTKKPPPKWWRKFELVMLVAVIPAAATIVQNFQFENELLATRLNLFISTGLVAAIKAVGMVLANGEEYKTNT